MSWVRVECSGGQRYAAPSHGRPAPRLDGLAHLFDEPVRLRAVHTFASLTPDAAAVSRPVEGSDTEACAGACVILDQRELGGHLGLVTVAVGDEADSDFLSSSEANLRQLLTRVFAVLRCTNESGTQLLLDALCTRAPAPLTASAAAEAVVVREDDGGRRVPPALWQSRAEAAGRSAGEVGALVRASGGVHPYPSGAAPSNRQFLLHLTQAQEFTRSGNLDEDDGAPQTKSLSLQPLQLNASSTSPLGQAPKKAATPADASAQTLLRTARQPLSYAAALRRRSLLFFVPQGVEPLSMLAARVQLTPTKPGRPAHADSTVAAAPQDGTSGGSPGLLAAAAGAPDAAAAPRALREVLVDVFVRVHTGLKGSGGNDASSGAAPRSSSARCVSHLRRLEHKLLHKSASWAAVAETAEESCRLLAWAVARLLAGNERPVRHSRAAALGTLLAHDLWSARDSAGGSTSAAPSAHGAGCSVPLVAAYSPSGLLLASPGFSTALHQDDRVVIAAVAVDRLARYSAPSRAAGTAATELAAVLRWTSWPMRAKPADGRAAPGDAVLDVLLLTVGDAAAVCLVFPRVPAPVAALSSTPSANLRAVVALLGTTRPTNAAAEKGGAASSSLLNALRTACTQSTAPYSAAFHDALFAVTALEDALDKSRGTNLPDHVRASAPPRASATHTVSTSHAVTATTTHVKAPGKHSRNAVTSALHKLFSCVPVCRRDPSKDIATASRQLCITAAEEQSSAYVQQLSSAAAPASTPPPPQEPSSAPTSSRDKASARARATAAYAAALLAMPLEVMLSYVAAVITRNELGVLRPTYELGLHSFFFLQQPQPTPEPAKSALRSVAGAAGSIARAKQTHGERAHLPQRFAVSFARFHVQQASCPSAVLPEEWADLPGAPDSAARRGGGAGCVHCFEDPSLLLQLNAVGSAAASPVSAGESAGGGVAGCAVTPEPAVQTELDTQVSVVPVWALLQVAPSDTPGVAHDASDTESDDSATAAAGDEAAGGGGGVGGFGPSSIVEDAQLVTSLHYTYPQRLRVRGGDLAEPAKAPPTTLPPPTAAPTAHPSAAASPAAAPPLPLPPPQQQHGNTSAAPSSSLSTRVWCNVEAVVNISGDITGRRQDILVKALHQHALSTTAAEDKLQRTPTHEGAADALQVDSLPAEWEYAAQAPSKAAALCREVVWCQAAALALLEGASSAE